MRIRGLAIGASAILASGAMAQNVVYSNLVTSQQQFVGSTTWWDDATIAGGGVLQTMRMYAYNAQGGAPRAFQGTIRIHQFNNATGLPDGPLLGEFPFQNTALIGAGQSLLLDSQDLTSLNIALPANGRLGIEFVFASNFGALMYNPPTIGSSTDPLWIGVPPVPMPITGRVGNLGISLSTVPAPAAAATGAFAGLAATLRRRRR